MHDSFITSINTQMTTMDWMNMLIEDVSNIYTPGFREYKGNFKTFLDGSSLEEVNVKTKQGKSYPGTAPENVFLEGNGFFAIKDPNGKMVYTRLGDFTFDSEGVYRAKNGNTVQGYILNDSGEVMSSSVPQKSDPNTATGLDGGPALPATTNIKLWIDPGNGKYLGKYDEFEIKEDGILYGKADKGKTKVPLYKLAIFNFHNPGALTQLKYGYFVENKASGKPVVGTGDIRSGLIEMSNTDFRMDVAFIMQAKMQLDMTNKLITTNKQLLEEAMRLLQ